MNNKEFILRNLIQTKTGLCEDVSEIICQLCEIRLFVPLRIYDKLYIVKRNWNTAYVELNPKYYVLFAMNIIKDNFGGEMIKWNGKKIYA